MELLKFLARKIVLPSAVLMYAWNPGYNSSVNSNTEVITLEEERVWEISDGADWMDFILRKEFPSLRQNTFGYTSREIYDEFRNILESNVDDGRLFDDVFSFFGEVYDDVKSSSMTKKERVWLENLGEEGRENFRIYFKEKLEKKEFGGYLNGIVDFDCFDDKDFVYFRRMQGAALIEQKPYVPFVDRSWDESQSSPWNPERNRENVYERNPSIEPFLKVDDLPDFFNLKYKII